MRYLIVILFVVFTGHLLAQNVSASNSELISNQDSLTYVLLTEAVVQPNTWWTRRTKKRYGRLKKKVVKVYPYAKAAGDVMRSIDAELQSFDHKKDRKKFLKGAEDDLKTQFEGELKSLTMSEGIILIKLIDRETGNCSYELIQELKGSFSAFMWQSFARLFGQNLKSEYDPKGDDWAIEEIVKDIEYGYILVDTRSIDAQQTHRKEKSQRE